MTSVEPGRDAGFVEGQREAISHKVTQGEILAFAELSGDDNPMHVDERYVREKGYPGLVSHGILTASLLSRVIGTRLPGDGALWTSQDLEFSGVVHPGDVITAEVVVKRVLPRDHLLILDAEVRNQYGDVVLRGRGRVHYPSGSESTSPPLEPRPQARSALVLGASGSIGRAICEALLADGVECLGVFRDSPDPLERMRLDLPKEQGARLQLIQADLASVNGRAALLGHIASLARTPLIVISAASTAPRNRPLNELGVDAYEQALGVDLLPLIEVVHFLAPAMQENRFGRVIGLGSTAAVGRPDAGWSPYVVAKAALGAYLKSVALELGSAGVTANVVVPGMTATGMTATLSSRFKTIAGSDTPTGHLTTPGEVASAVAYLCSAQAGNISGQRIVIDGGREMPW